MQASKFVTYSLQTDISCLVDKTTNGHHYDNNDGKNNLECV